MRRYICVHGHFYQPPRENPWLEQVEMQDSAYPYHDWNARIAAECYAQNGASRILDRDGKIASIVNNYARISFNFGPTLLSWLQENARDAYEAIVEADRESRRIFSGHGAACAQAYNHPILPLANHRDKLTQVRWGIRDFEFRFGRRPEGMWLPETAVDTATLDVLAAEGIVFTVLSPYQAKQTRAIGTTEWSTVEGGHVDTSRAYRVRLPSGRSIAVFFYDGPTSRAVAFERLLHSGEDFARRLLGQLSGASEEARLEHIATDGETYGHHHRHGDMALAYALAFVQRGGEADLTIYGEFLERHPPKHEAQIVEKTSWSCAHGVERWEADCGCNSGGHPGWHQRWRGPMRAAFDWLRDTIAPEYQRLGSELFTDPWVARDDYIDVVLDRSRDTIERFLRRNAKRALGDSEKITALKLLELQRHAMYMYTSCGWFFDDVSGIEAVQVIQYAGRAVQLAQELFARPLEAELLTRLEATESNLGPGHNGRTIYETNVRSTILDLKRVAAHYAVSSLFEDYPERATVYCYEVTHEAGGGQSFGKMTLGFGRAAVSSRVTLESQTISYAALHFGDHNIAGGVREFAGSEAYEGAVKEVAAAFSRADIPELIRLFDKHFRENTFSLRSLFRDRQRQVIDLMLTDTLANTEQNYIQMYDQNAPLMLFLSTLGIPIPRALHVAAEQALNGRLREELSQLAVDEAAIHRLLDEARARKVNLDTTTLEYTFHRTVASLAEAVVRDPSALNLGRLMDAVALRQSLPFEVDLWRAQNVYFGLRARTEPDVRRKANAGEPMALQWMQSFESLRERLGIARAT